MDSSGGSKLPVHIIERVLSFLPVPVLCRLRSVCKTWNELIAEPSFHDLCDRNGKNEVYLFIWREDNWYNHRESAFSFLDLEAGRWYSIKAAEPPRVCGCGSEVETRMRAMDDGLVCELTSLRGTERNFALTLSDPVAKIRRTLPAPPEFYSQREADPRIVTVVDDVTRSYKVFLFNNLCRTREVRTLPRVYVHESFSNEWRGLRNLPNGVKGIWAESAVGLHKSVFVAKSSSRGYEYDQLTLFTQKLEENDSWAEVWRMSFCRGFCGSRVHKLVVSDNRLFVSVWLKPDNCKLYPLRVSNCPNSESLFQTNQDYPGLLIEMYEILIPENSRKPVVQLTYAQLRQIFGLDYLYYTNGFPCFDSNGRCNSVVLVHYRTGQLRRYHLATGSVDVLPPHPLVSLVPPFGGVQRVRNGPLLPLYQVKNMKLSLRNVLAHGHMSGVEAPAGSTVCHLHKER